MKTIVIYTSKYGSTEKYAKWIGTAMGCPAKKLKDLCVQDLDAYDTILYGGGLYAGGIAGFKKFLKKLGMRKDKNLILFMVGMTNPTERDAYEKVANENIPLEWKNHFKVFALRGDQLFHKMSVVHKVMMQLPKSIAMKKPAAERTEEEKKFLESFGKDVIFSSKEQIEPILSYLRKNAE